MLHILLPAFNEEQNLRAEVSSLDAACRREGLAYEIVVVDDGSSDGTAALAKSLAEQSPLRLIEHGQNRGLGAALRTGIADLVARAAADDVIVIKDADNSQDSSALGPLCRRLAEGADVVIASRYRPGSREVGLAPHRVLLSRGASIVFQLLCPIPGVRDFTCGYRAFRAGVLAQAWRHYTPLGSLIERNDFSCSAELLLKVACLTERVAEVPFILRYDLKAGASKMRVWRTIRGNLTIAMAIRRQRAQQRPPAVAQDGTASPSAPRSLAGVKGATRRHGRR
jgi:dolichol-phosphate mannosyltransferase